MRKHIRIFGIAFLVAVLALPLDAFAACDAQKATLDARQRAVDNLDDEIDGGELNNSWIARLFLRIGNSNAEDLVADIEDTSKWEDYKAVKAKLATAEARLATAQANYDNCMELTDKVIHWVISIPRMI